MNLNEVRFLIFIFLLSGSWTCRFTAHMKSRKYLVKKGKVMGHVKHYDQVYHFLQDYDYILHRQYYCHGNTVGPAAIRKNIWYLSDKLCGGEVVGCAIISYEIGDNAAVKISKLRQQRPSSSSSSSSLLNNSNNNSSNNNNSNATVAVSPTENMHLLKAEMTRSVPEDMDVSSVVSMNPNAELQRFVSNMQVAQQ